MRRNWIPTDDSTACIPACDIRQPWSRRARRRSSASSEAASLHLEPSQGPLSSTIAASFVPASRSEIAPLSSQQHILRTDPTITTMLSDRTAVRRNACVFSSARRRPGVLFHARTAVVQPVSSTLRCRPDERPATHSPKEVNPWKPGSRRQQGTAER